MTVRLLASRIGRDLVHRNISISVCGTDFCYGLSKSRELMRLEWLRKLIKIIPYIGFQTRDLPASSIVP
jgi:hypothetical protein